MSETEMLGISTHLYVRLRKCANRVIDVVWMQRNPEYAREILQVARTVRDPEIQSLADRLEELITGARSARSAKPVPPSALLPLQPDVASRYRGALR